MGLPCVIAFLNEQNTIILWWIWWKNVCSFAIACQRPKFSFRTLRDDVRNFHCRRCTLKSKIFFLGAARQRPKDSFQALRAKAKKFLSRRCAPKPKVLHQGDACNEQFRSRALCAKMQTTSGKVTSKFFGDTTRYLRFLKSFETARRRMGYGQRLFFFSWVLSVRGQKFLLGRRAQLDNFIRYPFFLGALKGAIYIRVWKQIP